MHTSFFSCASAGIRPWPIWQIKKKTKIRVKERKGEGERNEERKKKSMHMRAFAYHHFHSRRRVPNLFPCKREEKPHTTKDTNVPECSLIITETLRWESLFDILHRTVGQGKIALPRYGRGNSLYWLLIQLPLLVERYVELSALLHILKRRA